MLFEEVWLGPVVYQVHGQAEYGMPVTFRSMHDVADAMAIPFHFLIERAG